MTEKELARLEMRLEGRVQGVGFRYFVQRLAQQMGVRGWVRNRWDGAVEVVAEADEETLTRFRDAVRSGPPGARVINDISAWREPTAEFSSFNIRSTT